MENLDELIAKRIDDTNRDKYGQVQIINCTMINLFPEQDLRNKIKEHLDSGTSLYSEQTYGNRYFTYKAINKKHDLKNFQ